MFNNDELFESLIKPKIVPKDLVLPSRQDEEKEVNKAAVVDDASLYPVPFIYDDRNTWTGASQSYIEYMWKDIIDVQINSPLETKLAFHYQNHPAKLRRSASVKHIGYKAIRVFVSSTFTDFFNEREVLVKQVLVQTTFDRLAEFCQSWPYFQRYSLS